MILFSATGLFHACMLCACHMENEYLYGYTIFVLEKYFVILLGELVCPVHILLDHQTRVSVFVIMCVYLLYWGIGMRRVISQ